MIQIQSSQQSSIHRIIDYYTRFCSYSAKVESIRKMNFNKIKINCGQILNTITILFEYSRHNILPGYTTAKAYKYEDGADGVNDIN